MNYCIIGDWFFCLPAAAAADDAGFVTKKAQGMLLLVSEHDRNYYNNSISPSNCALLHNTYLHCLL